MTIDAMGTQTVIAKQIVSQGGDYVLTVKDNHKMMAEDLRDLFDSCDTVQWADVPHDYAESVNKGHGRMEMRRCWTLTEPGYLTYVRRHASWANLTTLIRLERQRTSGGQLRWEVVYFLSSRSAPATFFLQVIRDHWAIENQLHWSLDVTFREDDNSTYFRHAAQNLALNRRLALMLLKRETSVKVGLQAKRMRAGWHNDYLLKVLSS